jgi:chromatin remodeling complex protein RSC6
LDFSQITTAGSSSAKVKGTKNGSAAAAFSYCEREKFRSVQGILQNVPSPEKEGRRSQWLDSDHPQGNTAKTRERWTQKGQKQAKEGNESRSICAKKF